MIYDPATAPHLKPWLVRTLEPICDAEPGALADYILALLKHNVSEPEMRKELSAQLDEFLEKECQPFVDTLFTVLRTKSFLPYSTESPAAKPIDNGIPIPLDLITPPPPESSERSRKRSIEADDRDGRPPAKGPRLNSEGQFSRYGNGSGRSSGQWEGRGNDGRGQGYTNGGMDQYNVAMMGGMVPMNGGRRPTSYQPPDQKRGICRDYHNNGYCARGAMCKYSHGDDAVVPGQLYPMGPGMPFMPMFPGGMPFGQGVGYDPHDSRIDMRPRHQRAPMLPRTHQDDGGGVVQASGELPVIQDLTPSIPKDPTEAAPADGQLAPAGEIDQTQPSQPSQPMDVSYDPQTFQGMQHMPPMPYMPIQPQMDLGMGDGHRGGYRGRGRGRGRGTFGGDVHNFRPERRGDKTLVVEKIPEDKLSLENVNDWFKRFGAVTNVAIDRTGGKALVSFSTHEEAHAAWKSEDAVFNNRFVKVFWHRPMEGQGQVGARMLAASASVVANIAVKPTGTSSPIITPSTSSSAPATAPRKASATPTNSAASALAAKQQLLEQQIAEQKSLMASLGTATPEEKKNIMTRLRKLGEEMKASSTPPVPSSQKSTPAPDDHEKKERERLDKELELHSAHVPSTPTPALAEKQETTEDLKAKLEKLKAEAASLGLSTEAPSGDWPSYRGGYRGRARVGRGFFRGAPRGGGAPRFNMSLDNRPKKLLLKGAKSEHLQAVRDWYETTGQLDSVDALEGGDVVVVFKTRPAAEQGLGKGPNIPMVGQLQISWYTGKPSAVTASLAPSSKQQRSHVGNTLEGGGTGGRPHTPEPEAEEEMVARGWGGDDDGDGMGML
ncbi:hypothetical protein P691DRAFT_662379 [Macrolepiota fuliginosa MF-IS2]|uniref:C3H1-type domain-containing protein n=1 Tax=Macrolepiota fuliginosa MF-IS2 TaxID=1400762 RepID=A0A9P5XJ07_9AGAR|nr:hypothetical protein P691DRAFT_662379 [Macrolepiota fuliginosa MF-IS2]